MSIRSIGVAWGQPNCRGDGKANARTPARPTYGHCHLAFLASAQSDKVLIKPPTAPCRIGPGTQTLTKNEPTLDISENHRVAHGEHGRVLVGIVYGLVMRRA